MIRREEVALFRSEVVPPAAAAALAQVRELPVDEASTMSAQERGDWLVALQQLTDAVHAASLQMLAAFDANGDGDTLHAARSSAAWLRGALGISGGDATTRVRLARASRRELAVAVEELRDGTVTYDHVRVIDKATRHLPKALAPQATDLLTELATRTGVGEVAHAGKHLASVIDPDGSFAAQEQDYTRRRLTLSPLLDGMVAVDGLLDPEAAATVNAALQPFLVPAGPADRRTASQRRADGLVAITQVATSQASVPISGGTRPTLNVVTDVATLTGQAPLGSKARPGVAMLPNAPGGAGAFGSLATQRIACDAAIRRVLLSPEGVPVDLGRTQRLFTSHQRHLLALRDGGCRFPGCDLPPAYTDAHHLIAWQQGGNTDLANAILVCRHHHRTLHEGRWRARPVDPTQGANGALSFRRPQGDTYNSQPRSLHQPFADTG